MISQAIIDRVEALHAGEGIPATLAVQTALESFSGLQARQRQILVDTRVSGSDAEWRLLILHVGHAIERSVEAADAQRRRHEKGSL